MMSKRIIVAFVSLLTGLSLFGQGKYSIGVNFGPALHFNTVYDGYYSNFSINPGYSIGFDFAKYVGAKSRLGVDFNFEDIGVGRDWVLDPNTVQSNSVKTSKMHVGNWGLNFSYGYKLLQFKKFEGYAVGTLKTAISTLQKEKTTLYGGDVVSSHYLDTNYRKARAGAAAGFRVKYNLSQHWGIILLPEYTCYFRNFYYQSAGPLQSFRCNLGMDLKF